MKREIKFRAWDKELKTWYKPTHEACIGNLFELMIGLSGDLSAHTLRGIMHESVFPDRFILMQFTGLHDKNGKDIYEGDIVIWHVNNLNRTGIVEYIDNYGGYDLKHTYDEYHVCIDWLRGEIEVIGNIYENTELL